MENQNNQSPAEKAEFQFKFMMMMINVGRIDEANQAAEKVEAYFAAAIAAEKEDA